MKFLLFFLFAFAYSFNAISQTADDTIGCEPMIVKFKSPLSETSVYWDFGDNGFSSDLNPSHTFNEGEFTVKLKKSETGDIIGTLKFYVYKKPFISLLFDKSTLTKGCVPLKVGMEANIPSTYPTQIKFKTNWTFGDGLEQLDQDSTTHIYEINGVFNIAISLISDIASCNTNKIFEKQISASNLPDTKFITDPLSASACEPPLDISFNNITTSKLPLKYKWIFGTEVQTTLNPTSKKYTQKGVYPVKLIATDTNECSAEFSKIISIGKPKTMFSINDSTCLFSPLNKTNIILNNTSDPGEYTWTFDSGTCLFNNSAENANELIPITSSNEISPIISFSTSGYHTIKLTTKLGDCFSDSIKTIYIEDAKIKIHSSNTYSCQNSLSSNYHSTGNTNIASFNWIFTNGSNLVYSNLKSPSNTTKPIDSIYSYRNVFLVPSYLSVKTTVGCYAIGNHHDTISKIWSLFTPNVHSGCKNLEVTFEDLSNPHLKKKIEEWNWNFGDGSPTLTTKTKVHQTKHTYTNTGKYSVQLIVKDDANCIDTSYLISIAVGDVLPIDFTMNKTSICRGDSIQFEPNTTSKFDLWNYSSNKEHTSQCFKENKQNIIFKDTVGVHDITLTGIFNGCESKITKQITVKGPIANFDYILDCKTPHKITLINKSQEADSCVWQVGDSIFHSLKDTTIFEFSLNGNINIKLTSFAKNGCLPDSTQTKVHIGKIKAGLSINSTVETNPGKIPVLDSGKKYVFDGSSSTDVSTDCYRGYSFITEKGDRPNTYSTSKDSFLLTNPLYQFVGMIVRNENNCVDTLKKEVLVINTNALFTMIDDKTKKDVDLICLPAKISFTDKSTCDTSIVKWFWDFGNGTTSTLKSPPIQEFLIANGDSLIINLTVTNFFGFVRKYSDIIYVYKPKAIITSNPSVNFDNKIHICANDLVQFSVTKIDFSKYPFDYMWKFPDGNESKFENTNHTFNLAMPMLEKEELVKLYFSEQVTGCKGDTSIVVHIENKPIPIITTDKDNDAEFCNPLSITFSNETSKKQLNTTSLWDLGNGVISSIDKPSYTYPKGLHSISLILTSPNGCSDTAKKTFKVLGPSGTFTLSTNSICKGDLVSLNLKDTIDVDSFVWDFGDGKIQENIAPIIHPYNFLPKTGFATVKLIVYGKQKVCPYVTEKKLDIKQVIADFEIKDLTSGSINDSVTCVGGNFSLTNTSKLGDIFKWSINSELSSSTNASTKFKTPGIYEVILYIGNTSLGCKDTIKKLLIVKDKPKVKAISDTICLNQGLISLATEDTLDIYNYNWTPTILTPKKTEYYVVTATDKLDFCSSKDSTLMFVVKPFNTIKWDTTIILGEKVKLPIDNQKGILTFTWTPPDGLSCSNCPSPIVQPLIDTKYTVKITDNYSCFSGESEFNIIVKPEAHIKLPTTFTPNGDKNNDIIYLEGWGIKSLTQFEIYNRWGEMVFNTQNMEEGWDGHHKGELQNNDVYAYKVIAISWFDKEIIKEGYIHLMR